jgi:hypothetical protein
LLSSRNSAYCWRVSRSWFAVAAVLIKSFSIV